MKNSIEESIKIIERKIKEAEHYTDITGLCLTLDKELCNAFINILSDYKRVSKENEQLRTEVNSLRKENEELKEERQIVGIPVRNKRDRRIGIVLHQWESGSVAVLESINPRVINTHDSWNTLEIVTDEVKQTQTKCETIPVSLVKDKIEELNRKIDKSIDNSKGGLDEEFIEKAGELLTQKRILQELLEGRE